MNQYIDYPRLREDLKAYGVFSLAQADAAESEEDGDDGMAAIDTAIAIPIANTLLDSYLTCNVVAGLIDSTGEKDVPQKRCRRIIAFQDI